MMKIALIAIGSLAVLILAVFIIGELLPKHHRATRSAAFHARPEQVFALVVAGPPHWRPEVKQYEVITNPGGNKMWRETDSHGNTIAYEEVECKAPILLKTRIATQGLPYGGSWTFALQDYGGSTTLGITEDGDVYNPIFRFVSRFVIGYTRGIDAYLTNISKALGEQPQIRD